MVEVSRNTYVLGTTESPNQCENADEEQCMYCVKSTAFDPLFRITPPFQIILLYPITPSLCVANEDGKYFLKHVLS